MTKEQARERITRLYEMIYYAQLMECKAAKITAQYYEETMEALEVAARELEENTEEQKCGNCMYFSNDGEIFGRCMRIGDEWNRQTTANDKCGYFMREAE